MAKDQLAGYLRAKGRSPQKGNAGLGIALSFSGGPELADGLRELGDFGSKATARNAVSRGMIGAAQPMVVAAKAGARRDDGDLADSIEASTRLSRRQKRARRKTKAGLLAEVFVGPDYRKGAHGIFQEFGTVERFHVDAIGAAHEPTGRVIAKPFMRPAFDSTAGVVLQGFAPSIWAEIKKATDRIRRKQARALKKAGK